MSRSGKITLDWADGTYPFALKIEQLAELQEKTGAGPWYIRWALEVTGLAASARVAPPKDMSPLFIIEPIRLGLIGGGMPAVEALRKVRAYVGLGQLSENLATAYAVIGVALDGVDEDVPGKDEAGVEMTADHSRAGEFDGPRSTALEQPSD